MIFQAKAGQVAYGEAIGILLLETFVPFIPGDVGNASTFSFPVRYQTIPGLTFKGLYEEQHACLPRIIEAAQTLEKAGVKVITSDCGFMILYQRELAEALTVPVFTSSLLQLPFIEALIGKEKKIGILTAESSKLTESILQMAGASPKRMAVAGMENSPYFCRAVFEEAGWLDSDEVGKEAVAAAAELAEKNPSVSVLLLECSMLAPYAKAIQDKVGLPVFDYVAMIEFVNRSVVKKTYTGFM